ncbi:MAG: hypothetical protein ACFFCS_07605 [Candidatus Hodarchaeota archaeon]
MSENYSSVYDDLKAENANVDQGCVLDPDGNVLFLGGDWDPSADAKELLDQWLNHGPRLTVQGTGYSILRSEPEQLISMNLAGKGFVVGSVTKAGNYLIAHLVPVSAEQAGRDFMDVARAAAKI